MIATWETQKETMNDIINRFSLKELEEAYFRLKELADQQPNDPVLDTAKRVAGGAVALKTLQSHTQLSLF
jgi:hypothetical protein